MPLNEEHEKRVELFMSIYNSEKVTWVLLCKNLNQDEMS